MPCTHNQNGYCLLDKNHITGELGPCAEVLDESEICEDYEDNFELEDEWE